MLQDSDQILAMTVLYMDWPRCESSAEQERFASSIVENKVRNENLQT